MMNKLMLAAALAASLVSGGAVLAQEAPKPLTAQQQKMKDCNAEAKSKQLKGQPRKDFMKVCLAGADGPAPDKPASPGGGEKQAAQQSRMKSCNAEAKEKGLKGQERKDFMKTCLSG